MAFVFSSQINRIISVIVPTVGRPSLEIALDCLNAQTVPLDVIVVDDSIDGCGSSRFHTWQKKQSERECHSWRCLQSHALGLSGARNCGLAECTGEFIGFLDDDDILCPHHYERLMKLITADPRLSFVWAPTILVFVEKTGHTRTGSSGFGWHDVRDKLPITNVIPPSAVLIRASVVPRFDKALPVQEDWDAWLNLVTLGIIPACTEHITVGYVKDLYSASSSTVQGGLDPEALQVFIDTYGKLCAKHNQFPDSVMAGRQHWRRQQMSWLNLLHHGQQLPPDYYEAALAQMFGPPITMRCCDFNFAAVLHSDPQDAIDFNT